MCGLTGFLHPEGFGVSDGQRCAEAMAAFLVHRGPDDSGVWADGEVGIALAHCRLAILDLSPAGHQPMMSASGRFVIVFNGEIYNHLNLRQELAGAGWRGHSDTETLLAAIETWGVAGALGRCDGMFAFALWDRETLTLTLARDRLGEKPLYYGWQGKTFLFGSELKALRVHPDFQNEIDRESLALFLRYNYIPAPFSIYKGIRKLLPGAFTVVRQGEKESGPMIYWSAQVTAETGQQELFRGDEQEAGQELELLLRQAVAEQMVADVPLGAFLSGGVDSSTIVALMQAQTGRAVQTFTIGFHNAGYNEAEQARAVARHLGTNHTELYVTPEDAMAVIPRLPVIYDEPFADSSQIPTFLVAQLARQKVTVALSGDGGDELFGGYNRHYWVPYYWRRFGWIPAPVRSLASSLFTVLSPGEWDLLLGRLPRAFPHARPHTTLGDKIHKLAEVMAAGSPAEMYAGLISFWGRDERLVIGADIGENHLCCDMEKTPIVADCSNNMMYCDLVSYLPDDILVKVDRAAMAVSLETRVPMLDHRLVEFAWRLPLDMKIRNGQGKWLLRQVLYKYVPKELVERPKMGFGIPLAVWLRGPLREWAESLLAEERLRREAFFHPAPVRQKWTEHLAGRRNWAYHLWGVLMFQAWLEQNS